MLTRWLWLRALIATIYCLIKNAKQFGLPAPALLCDMLEKLHTEKQKEKEIAHVDGVGVDMGGIDEQS